MQTSTHVASSLSNFGCVCLGPLETKPEDGRREFFSPRGGKGGSRQAGGEACPATVGALRASALYRL